MSTLKAREWLISQNSTERSTAEANPKKAAKTVAITSGKGGVGKTSVALKFGQVLSYTGHRVLLLDCDANLANAAVKMNLPIKDHLSDILFRGKSFEDCLYKDGNFHLLPGCNGSLELYNEEYDITRFVSDLVSELTYSYDYIIFDSPAGLGKDVVSLSCLADTRMFVVTPDRSSITDSYSLMKILGLQHGIKDHYLVANKVSSDQQTAKIVTGLSETAENYFNASVKSIGSISNLDCPVDQFDRELLKNADSRIQREFLQVAKRFAEECSTSKDGRVSGLQYQPNHSSKWGQNVQTNAS